MRAPPLTRDTAPRVQSYSDILLLLDERNLSKRPLNLSSSSLHAAARAPCATSTMPPKKAEEVVKKPLLGRPTNHVKMGIVGLPNVRPRSRGVSAAAVVPRL